MIEITGTSGWNAREHGEAETQKPLQTLDQDAFLKLLVMQMTNQDPLSPVEDREFIAQMAQFTALEQMQELNKTSKANHEELMAHMVGMNNNLVNSQTTIATQLTKMNAVLEAYWAQSGAYLVEAPQENPVPDGSQNSSLSPDD